MDFRWLVEAVWIGVMLIAVHFISDLVFQKWMQEIMKALSISYTKNDWRKLVLHCLIYSLTFLPVFLWLGINLWWLVLLFASHFIIDKKGLVHFFYEQIKKIFGRDLDILVLLINRKHFILRAIDQLLHFSVIGAVLLFIGIF